MKRWLMLLPLALVLLLASTVSAQKVIVPTPIDSPPDIRHYQIQVTDPTNCLFGNLNEPAWAVDSWLFGQEGYKFLFHPWDTCACPFGFWLQVVHIYLQFPAGIAYPCEFEVYVDLEDALWDDAVGCWVPGIEDCVSPVYNVSIPQSGLYDISLPIGDFCDCAFMDYWYFLSVHFPGAITADLILDSIPTPCTAYGNWSGEWIDLFNFGLQDYGNVIIYGEGVCCDFPIDARQNSWGEVKSLYR